MGFMREVLTSTRANRHLFAGASALPEGERQARCLDGARSHSGLTV